MMGQRCVIYFGLVLFLLSVATLPFLSCSPRKTYVYETSESIKSSQPDVSFRKIILYRFEADENITQSIPEATSLCENSALHELLNLDSAASIAKASSSTPRQKDALIVKARLVPIRTTPLRRANRTSPANKLAVHVRLIDASNGKTLAEEIIFASSSGNRAPETPTELGAAVARYIDKFIRKQ